MSGKLHSCLGFTPFHSEDRAFLIVFAQTKEYFKSTLKRNKKILHVQIQGGMRKSRCISPARFVLRLPGHRQPRAVSQQFCLEGRIEKGEPPATNRPNVLRQLTG